MSTTTDNMTVTSQVPAPVTKQTDYKNLNTGEDFRSQANNVVMPPQPAPRGETNDSESAGA